MAYQSEIEKLKRRYDEKPEQWFAALADAHRKNGEIEQALAIVRSGIKERPNYVSGHIVLGRCLVDKGVDDEAEKVFEEVLELDAENIIALKVLGDVAERRGNVEGARRWLERLLEVDPMNEEARDALGRVLVTSAQPLQPATITPPDPDVEILRHSAEQAAPAADEISQDDYDTIPPEFDVEAVPSSAAVAEPRAPEAPKPAEMPEEQIPTLEKIVEPPVEAVPQPEVTDFTIERASDPFARADQAAEDLSELLDTGTRVVSFDEPEPASPAAPVAGLTDASSGLGFGVDEDEADEPKSQEREDRSTEVAGLEAQDLSWLAEVAANSWPPDREDASPPEESTADIELDVGLVEGDTQPIPSQAVGDLRRSGPTEDRAPARAVESPQPAAKRAEPPAVAKAPESQAAEDSDGVVTETMAEVFAAQGLIDQARDVYLKLLRQRPTDESIRHKLVELEHRRKAHAPARASAAPEAVAMAEPERSSASRTVAASATGGTSVRSFFSDLLSKRPTSGSPVVTASAADPKSVAGKHEADVGQKRAGEPSRAAGVAAGARTNRGEPTRPAGDEVSLASVFGDQSSDDVREPNRREGKSAPKAGAGTGAPDVGMTFDRFFGGSADDTKSEEAPSAAEDDDEDFKAWLQGLKS